MGFSGLETGIFESSQEKSLNTSHFLVTKKNISIFGQNSWLNKGGPYKLCGVADCYIMVNVLYLLFSSSMAIYRILLTVTDKSSTRDEPVSAREVSIPCLRTQLCLKMHQVFISAHSYFKKFPEGHAPGSSEELRGFRPLGTSPTKDKS